MNSWSIAEQVVAGLLTAALGGLFLWVWSKVRVARLPRLPKRLPKEPITGSSLLAYVNSSERLRELDRSIAADLSVSLLPRDGGQVWVEEQVVALQVKHIRALDKLVAEHAHHARLLARVFQARPNINAGTGLGLVLEIEAMERFGDAWFDRFLKGLQYTSTSRGFADSLLEDYRRIKKHGG